MTIKLNKRLKKHERRFIYMLALSTALITLTSLTTFIMYLQALNFRNVAELKGEQIKMIQSYQHIITVDESCMTQLEAADFVQLRIIK